MDPERTVPNVPRDVTTLSASGPIRVIIEPPRTNWLARILRWGATILLVVLAAAFMQKSYDPEGGVDERWHSLSQVASDKIAIISVEGAILGEEGFAKKQIDRVRDDEHVKAIVVRVDSPGGTVTGSDFLYHHLKKLAAEKQVPLVISMGSIAASGGYYISMAAGESQDAIFAEPTTWTGSIGVVIPHYDVSGLLEKWNVQDDSIASNPLKLMGSPTRKFPEPIRAEEQKILQGLVDTSFASFKEIVLASRPALRADQAAQDSAFTGRIFTAKQALENHLVDKIGFVEDAIDRALELARLDRHNVRVVKYHRRESLLEQMLVGPQSRKVGFDVTTLAELAVPRAYYLCSWLPGITNLAQR